MPSLLIGHGRKGRSSGSARQGFSSDVIDDMWVDNMPCPSSDDFGDVLQSMIEWASRERGISGFREHKVLERLFGVGPLPKNIISAMAEFLVECLYLGSVYDVDCNTCSNVFCVIPFLERCCYESPGNAPIVWDCLKRAILNAVNVVSEIEIEDIGDRERETFQRVIFSLISVCIQTRAHTVIPEIRRLYEGTAHALVPDLLNHEALIQKINNTPRVFADTISYYSLHHEEL